MCSRECEQSELPNNGEEETYVTATSARTLIAGVNKQRSGVRAGERKSLAFLFFYLLSCHTRVWEPHTHMHTHTRTHTSLCGESPPNTSVLCARTDYEERPQQLAKRGPSGSLDSSISTFSRQRAPPGRAEMSSSRYAAAPCLPNIFAHPPGAPALHVYRLIHLLSLFCASQVRITKGAISGLGAFQNKMCIKL